MGEDNYIEQLQLRPAQVMARVFRQNITLHFYNRFLQSRLFRKLSQLLNGAFETLIISKEDETKMILLGSRIFNWTDTIIRRSFRNKGSIKIVLCAAKYAICINRHLVGVGVLWVDDVTQACQQLDYGK